MTTASKAASNGNAASDATKKRVKGMARVKEGETWRTASVMHDAAYEGELLCREIYNAIYEAYQPGGDSTAADLAASPDIRAKAEEAVYCLNAAIGFLVALTGSAEPPF